MSKRTIYLIFGLLVVALATMACGFSASTAKIDSATLTNDENNVVATSVFSADEIFYLVVVTKNAPDDTTLKAVWKAVEVEGVDPGFVIDEKELAGGSDTYTLSLSNDNLWPAGKYKVELFLNGELDQTLEFQVQ